ncbi:MAG: M18 family aminopeptidase [Gammaproteobacteria bacterium]|nr:M18 family aminopeptidase [Gammaproteobacteria bacterium]
MNQSDINPDVRQHAQALLDFIDASPSPWHAVASIRQSLDDAGFTALRETDSWELNAGSGYYVIRDDSSIIFFRLGEDNLQHSGFRIIGAHTDSPGFRIKPNALIDKQDTLMLGVEVYGGPILATFTDRDLSLAGRVSLRSESVMPETRLVKFDQALARIPNLAIHMNRDVNTSGLKLDLQNQLPLLLTVSDDKHSKGTDVFRSLLAQQLNCESDAILSWELAVFDTHCGGFWGTQSEFIADSQLDNLASCHAGMRALLDSDNHELTQVCAFFDHEEIGSESVKGGNSSFLGDVLNRIAIAHRCDRQQYRQALARSLLISADMSHAWQPSFASAYEPDHHVLVNSGPVIKVNANHRYASNAVTEAMFMQCCEQANVPWQHYVHRNDIPCGSTIGPMSAARLGIQTVDAGNPMWAMHSVRESAGVLDHTYFTAALSVFLGKN